MVILDSDPSQQHNSYTFFAGPSLGISTVPGEARNEGGTWNV